MYERFYGFRERPFELTPDPRFLFLSKAHREALANLAYGIVARKGLTVLVGEVGSGKTTLLRRAVADHAGTGTRCIVLKNPHVTPEQFSAFVRDELGLSPDDSPSRRWSGDVEAHLATRWAAGDGAALVIDEAQNLSVEMFEELRLLTNMETDEAKLLPVLLVGQPELRSRLNEPQLRHLKQRIALRCELRALTLEETAAYVNARITVAGGQSSQVFTREAVSAIHRAAHGLPRTISVLCDNALLTGFAAGEKPVTSRTVAEVCKDFEYSPEGADELNTVPYPDAVDVDQPGTTDAISDSTPAQSVPETDKASERELFGHFQRGRVSVFGVNGR
jgi:general secretion pathway protein A